METRIPTPNQDLLPQVKPEREPLPKGFFTLLGIEILAVLLAGAAGYAARAFLRGNWGMYQSAAVIAVFFAVSAFGTVFAPVRWRRLLVIFLETAAFVLFFAGQGWLMILSAAACMFVFSVWGDEAARREMSERLRIHLLPVVRLKTGRAFTGYLIGGIILSVPFWPASGMPLGQDQFRSFYQGTVGLVGGLYPEVKLNSTVSELAQSLVRKEAAGSFADLPPNVQDQEVRNAADTMVTQAAKSLNLDITGNESVSDAFYSYLTATISGWKNSFGSSFTVIWAIALFIFLRGLGAILVWVSMFLTIGLFELLSAFGIFATVGEASMKEILVISKG